MKVKTSKYKSEVLYHRLSKTKKKKKSWGSIGNLFSNWDEFKLNGYLIDFQKNTNYSEWADNYSENLCLVEKGSGILIFKGKQYKVKKGFALKIFPGQNPVIKPQKSLTMISVQMPSSVKIKRPGEDLERLSIVDVEKVETKVYLYETLGQEIFTPKYEKSLGLLTFLIPLREIPFHIHPYSGRLIRGISGKGWTYAEPNLYEINDDTFTLFPKGTVHSNGPVPGEIFKFFAIQIPWIESKVDEKNIAGVPKFIKYVATVPPKKLWKTKQDFLNVLNRFSK